MKAVAIIVAAGRSERLGGDVPKQFRAVAGRPLLAWTLARFEQAASIDEIVLVVSEDNLLYAAEKVVNRSDFPKVSRIIAGGDSRQESVLKGLEKLPVKTGLVAIHDGARPLVTPEQIDEVMQLAATERAAILAAPMADTVKRVEDGCIVATLDRAPLCQAQTPQAFQYDLIMEAHKQAAAGDTVATDDAALVEQLGVKVRVVINEQTNLKVTTAADLHLVEALLCQENNGQ